MMQCITTFQCSPGDIIGRLVRYVTSKNGQDTWWLKGLAECCNLYKLRLLLFFLKFISQKLHG